MVKSWFLAGLLVLLPPIHSLDVMEIVVLQLFSFQLEGVGDQACLRRPRLWA